MKKICLISTIVALVAAIGAVVALFLVHCKQTKDEDFGFDDDYDFDDIDEI